MITFNIFIIVALVAVLAGVGLLAWMIDGGVSEKKKTYFQIGLFGLFAGVIGLFFMITDESEFDYAGANGKDKKEAAQAGGMGGGGGGMAANPDGDGEMPADDGGAPDDADPARGESDCDECPVMVKIAEGTALLGAALQAQSGTAVTGPATRLGISKGYAIGKFEVTVGQFGAFVKETGYKPASTCRIGKSSVSASFKSPGFTQSKDHPAVCVSWTDAKHYTEWLTLKAGRVYRLPTEVEWEYAARGGVTSGYLVPGGKLSSKDANFANPVGEKENQTTKVGSYAENPNHMHDVHGNAWEFTDDCWSRVYALHSQDKTYTGWDCSKRIVKGGAWFSPPERLDLAIRAGVGSELASNGIGFRVMREPVKPVAGPEGDSPLAKLKEPKTDSRVAEQKQRALEQSERAETFKAELEANGIQPVLADENGRPTALGRSLGTTGLPAGAGLREKEEAEAEAKKNEEDAARALGQVGRAIR